MCRPCGIVFLVLLAFLPHVGNSSRSCVVCAWGRSIRLLAGNCGHLFVAVIIGLGLLCWHLFVSVIIGLGLLCSGLFVGLSLKLLVFASLLVQVVEVGLYVLEVFCLGFVRGCIWRVCGGCSVDFFLQVFASEYIQYQLTDRVIL